MVGPLELESHVEGNRATVVVRGEVDIATSPQLREVLTGLVGAGANDLVLECQDLGFLDSSGISVLIAVRNQLGETGALTIESPPAHVRKVLELTGMNQHVSIVP